MFAVLAGCATGTQAPIEQKSPDHSATASLTPRRPSAPTVSKNEPTPAAHVVVRGDTVHAVAWRYRIDYRDLIRWNGLRNPDLIYIGQRLRLAPPPASGASAVSPATAAPRVVPAAPSHELAVKHQQPPTAAPAAVAVHGPLRWVWPADGRTSAATSVSGTKGLEIRGTRGQNVKAAAAGTVVYSGSGLRGYGELIILKHNDTFLSAYAHNEVRLVQEGGRVETGEAIARMGNTDSKDVMLHFEIRRNGKAVDPLQYLPKR